MPIDSHFFAGRPLHGPDDSLGFILWRVTHAWQRMLEQRLAPYDLTHLRWALLVALAWLTREGEIVSQRHLADFLDMQPMQVSQVLGAMERSGLIARQPTDTDRRILSLTLTAMGESRLREAMPVVEAAHRAFFGDYLAQGATLRASLLGLLEPPPAD